MDKSSFKEDTRYTITWRDPAGRVKPLNLYVFRVYEKFLVARDTSGEGLLRKISYEDVIRIVQEKAVAEDHRFAIPPAVLDEKAWRDRSVMERYSSAPGMGK